MSNTALEQPVGPIGRQILALPPDKRVCPNCTTKLTVAKGCSGTVVPECAACGVMFPTGSAGDGVYLVFDCDGNIGGMGLTCEPNNQVERQP